MLRSSHHYDLVASHSCVKEVLGKTLTKQRFSVWFNRQGRESQRAAAGLHRIAVPDTALHRWRGHRPVRPSSPNIWPPTARAPGEDETARPNPCPHWPIGGRICSPCAGSGATRLAEPRKGFGRGSAPVRSPGRTGVGGNASDGMTRDMQEGAGLRRSARRVAVARMHYGVCTGGSIPTHDHRPPLPTISLRENAADFWGKAGRCRACSCAHRPMAGKPGSDVSEAPASGRPTAPGPAR
jgi:hypothetical protein